MVCSQEISVGVSAALSGRFQLHGQQALDGILLWQSYANAQGGIPLGASRRPVRLVWYDDGSRVSRVRENLHRLIRNDRVDVLLGPYSSASTMAAAEIAEDANKILWNYGGTSDEIFRQGWRRLIGTSSPASDYLRAFPDWLAKERPDVHRISIVHSAKGSFASHVARGILEAARHTGQSVDLVPFDPPLRQTSRLEELIGHHSQAVVLAASFEDEMLLLGTRARWPGTVQALAAVAAGTTVFATRLGQTSEGVLGPSQWEPGTGPENALGPASAWFVDTFQKQFRATPDYVAAGSFATGVILTECICRADSLDDQRLRAIASTLDCHTFYGCFRIDGESGKQIGHRILLVRWQQGRKVVLPPPVCASDIVAGSSTCRGPEVV